LNLAIAAGVFNATSNSLDSYQRNDENYHNEVLNAGDREPGNRKPQNSPYRLAFTGLTIGMTIAGTLMVYGTKTVQGWGKVLLGLAIGTQSLDTFQLKFRSKKLAAERIARTTEPELDANMFRPPKITAHRSPSGAPSVSERRELPSMSLASRDHSDNGERELSDVRIDMSDVKREYSVSGREVIEHVMREIAEEKIAEPLKQAEKIREALSRVVVRDERTDILLDSANAYLDAHNAIKKINSIIEPKDESRSIEDLRQFFANPVNKEKYREQVEGFMENSVKYEKAENAFKVSYAEYFSKQSGTPEQSQVSSEEVSRPRFHSTSSSIPLPTTSYTSNIESSIGNTAVDRVRRNSGSKASTLPPTHG